MENKILFDKGEILKDTSLEGVEKHTEPKPRFTEASFIAELTKRGIGRPSTYATILTTLLDEKRGYCKLDNKKIVPTELGMKLSDFLAKSFGDIINITYTADLESQLDLIAKGEKNQVEFMEDFYGKLEENINKVDPSANDAGEPKTCPKCGKPLVKRFSRKVKKSFWGCSGYPDCTYIENINYNK